MIRLAVFDFDGVFTDGKCYFDGGANIRKHYNVKDGMALRILRERGIVTGLLSSYSSNREVYLNEKRIDDEVADHLGFDYKSIGNSNKMQVLDEWMEVLGFDYADVAYIGDDINDLPVMQKVGFSACPCDAVEACKSLANYTCARKGGDGCVREFADMVVDRAHPRPRELVIMDEIRAELNYQMESLCVGDVTDLADTLTETEGNIYLCGVGKSGNIAKHCCDLLKSVSLPAFYLDALNSMHGDIGTLTDKDTILMFSNSGNTKELADVASPLAHIGAKLIGVCCSKKSRFEVLCDRTIVLPFRNEIGGEINKIPTNSFMSCLLFSNVLVSVLKNRITLDRYKANHLSGSIGRDLLKIRDVLVEDFPKTVLGESTEINDVLLEMTEHKMGCCFFVNKDSELLGILTDGDVRRLLLKDRDVGTVTCHNINTDFYYESDMEKHVCDCRKVAYIPVLRGRVLIGIVVN